MPELSVPWGQGELRVVLPEHWELQQVARPSLPKAKENWPDELAMLVSQSGGEAGLGQLLAARRCGRIILVVEDATRHSPLAKILEVIMREISHARIGENQMEVVFATGMHPPVTPEEAGAKLGPFAQSLRWRSNPCHDPDAYVCLGRAEGVDVWLDRGVASADLRILISSVSPHLQAGFGGGYKMLFPGCARIDTIRALHRLGVSRSPRPLVGTDGSVNPMRKAIDAAGELADRNSGRSYGVLYVLDESDFPTFIAVGEAPSSQQMLAKRCSVACGVLTGSPADILLVNAYPRDNDLWQSFKCIANTQWAARAGGVIVCLSRCEMGAYGMKIPPWPLSPTGTRRLVRLLGPGAMGSLLTRLVPSLAGDAAFFVRLALATVNRNPVLMVSPTLHAALGRFPGLTILPTVEQAFSLAERILGAGPRRVVAFPSGGITFPVPASSVETNAGERP